MFEVDDGGQGIDRERARAEMVRAIIHRDAAAAQAATRAGQEGHLHGDAVLQVLQAIARGEEPAAALRAAAFARLVDEVSADGMGDTSPSSESSGDGFEEVTGLDAEELAAAEGRDAARGDEPDPLEGLADRIRAEGRPELAFDPVVVAAALALEDTDLVAFGELGRHLKAAGVSLTHWRAALKAARKARGEALALEAQERDRERRRKAAAEMAEAKALAEGERAKEVQAKAQEDPVWTLHFAERAVDDAEYLMEPGKVTVTTPGARGEPKVVTLANFSAPITGDVSEYEAPGAEALRFAELSVVLGEAPPRRVEVSMRDFGRMDWVAEQLGPRAWMATGRTGRDRLAQALGALSSPVARKRYGYTGWQKTGDRWVYLHAGGAIGAEGVVPGVEVRVYEPVSRFALPPPPEGEALARAVTSVLAFLDIEPAGAVLPVAGQVFRAALGQARCSIHVYGEAGVGKSLLTALGQQFFAPGAGENSAILSWRVADSKVAVTQILAKAGDCVVMTDDLKLSGNSHADQEVMARADFVFASVYGAKGRHLGRREGGVRSQPAPRSVVLSSGEVLPRAGNSLIQRILPISLEDRMTGDVLGAMERGRAGVHAGFMAAFIQWVAARYEEATANLVTQEVNIADALGLGKGERAAKLLGALALGLAQLFEFLRVCGVPSTVIDHHATRAQAALAGLSGHYDETAAEQNPAAKFIETLASALASGRCHATTPKGYAPSPPHAFGWRAKGAKGQHDADTETTEAPDFQPCGERVGYVDVRNDRFYLLLKPALAIVRRVAGEGGDVVNVDPSAIPRLLHKAGHLVSPEYEQNGTFLARPPAGCGTQRMLCIRLGVLVGDRDGPGEDCQKAA